MQSLISPESTLISKLLNDKETKAYKNWLLGFESDIKSYDDALKDEVTAIQNSVPVEVPTDHEYFNFVEIQDDEPLVFARYEKHKGPKTNKGILIQAKRPSNKDFRHIDAKTI